MTRPTQPVPASVWIDRVTQARGRQAQAERVAEYLLTLRLDPSDPYAADLRTGRRDAALAEADAWRLYAQEAERAFASAAEDEMRRADERELRHGRYEDGAA